MLKLFRRLRRNSGGLRKYLTYAFGEILLVMIGILLAIQVNNLNTKRLEKESELQSYQNLKRQLWEDSQAIAAARDYNSKYLKEYLYAIQIIEANDRDRIDTLGYITSKLIKYSDFDRKSNIYETIVNSGEIRLLENDEIKEGLQKLEGTFLFFNRMENIHYDVISSAIPELIGYLKYSNRKVVEPESIYSLRLQNLFITISEIMKQKDEIYNRALSTGQKPDFKKYAQKVEQFIFNMVKAQSKDADEFSLAFFQMFDGDLMAFCQKVFPSFKCPDKSYCQDEDQRIDPLQFGQVCILKVEASAFNGAEEHFNTPAFAVQWSTMS